MKLVIIYGSEASGKFSVAKQLAEPTNLRLFHITSALTSPKYYSITAMLITINCFGRFA
jgi:hypothetical protein